MRVAINRSIVTITGKLSEEKKITAIYEIMMQEFESMCLVEALGVNTGADMVEVSLCYAADEATVLTVKMSYSEAKEACKIIH
jgi:hypothetical protein